MDNWENEALTKDRYTYGEVKVLGKGIKAELEKLKMFKMIKRSREQETREVKRSLECIIDNTLELLQPEDAKAYLTRKLLELGVSIPKVSEEKSEPNVIQTVVEEAKEEAVAFTSGWTPLGEQWYKFTDVTISIDGASLWALGSEKVGFGGYPLYQYLNNHWTKQAGSLARVVADRGGEIWGVKATGQVVQIIHNQEIPRTETGVASQIAVSSNGGVWITTTENLRAKGIYLMYYDFHTQKFEVEKKAHFYCKSLAVLPNGIPIVVTENGDLYLFMKRHDGVQTEMVRVLEPTGYIHIQSVSVATDVEPENAVWERLTVWGVSDQEDA